MINEIKNLLFPKRCVSCGTILPAVSKLLGEERVLCGACRGKWEAEKGSHCRRCGKRYSECRCANHLLCSHGVKVHLKLASYRASSDSVANKMIHRMKRKNDTYLFDFVSEQLGRPLLRYVIEKDIDADSVVITYVPRNSASVAKYGYDHAYLIAERIASSVSLEVSSVIERVKRSTEQKRLSRAQRLENVKGVFELIPDTDMSDKTVFIIDDVVTSGASMAQCAKVLYEAGARDVVAVSVVATK